MKRSDLTPGEAYYYDKTTNWMDGGWHAEKVVLVDDKRYKPSDRWGRRPYELPYREDPKGQHVLVDATEMVAGQETVRRKVVPLTHLRGPWEAARAAVLQARDDRQKADAARVKAQREAGDLAARQTERAEALGIRVIWYGGKLQVKPEDMARLLDAYEQTHPTAALEVAP